MAAIQRAMASLAFLHTPEELMDASSASTAPMDESGAERTHWAETPYGDLFEEQRWADLATLFRDNLLKLNGLTLRSPLEIVLSTGLSVLKTDQCRPPAPATSNGHQGASSRGERKARAGSEKGAAGTHSQDCPVCSSDLYQLASRLPPAPRAQSRLRCRITGSIMDEDNRPLALPNGYIYSGQALERMAAAEGANVTCPCTQHRYPFSECRRVFVM